MMAVTLVNATDEHRVASDESMLLGVFSVEVWEMILNQLKKPGDLKNCSNASKFFRKLFLPNRIFFLFPDVLEIMLAKDKLDSENSITLEEAESCFKSTNEAYWKLYKEWGVIAENIENSDSEDQRDDNNAGKQANGNKNKLLDYKVGLTDNRLKNISLKQGWHLFKFGWKQTEKAWHELLSTLNKIKHGNQLASYIWKRQTKLWNDEIVKGWGEIREMMNSNEINLKGFKKSVDTVVLNGFGKMRNITDCAEEWTDAIRILRLVCVDWDKKIGNWQVLPDKSAELVETSGSDWIESSDDDDNVV